MQRQQKLFGVFGAIVLAPCAAGQSINVDFGDPATAPSADYAAAGVAGVWNAINDGLQPHALVGLQGQDISATIEWSLAEQAMALDDKGTIGDAQQLLDDFLPGWGDVAMQIKFQNLEGGHYEVITYAWFPAVPSEGSAVIMNGDITDIQTTGGEWPGELQLGITHTQHTVDVLDGDRITIQLIGAPWGNSGAINGVQLVRIEPAASDLNGDGLVDIDDLFMLLAVWTTDGHGCDGVKPCLGDINHDLFVDVDDLFLMLNSWTP